MGTVPLLGFWRFAQHLPCAAGALLGVALPGVAWAESQRGLCVF